jgi:hypothetical protein
VIFATKKVFIYLFIFTKKQSFNFTRKESFKEYYHSRIDSLIKSKTLYFIKNKKTSTFCEHDLFKDYTIHGLVFFNYLYFLKATKLSTSHE